MNHTSSEDKADSDVPWIVMVVLPDKFSAMFLVFMP